MPIGTHSAGLDGAPEESPSIATGAGSKKASSHQLLERSAHYQV